MQNHRDETQPAAAPAASRTSRTSNSATGVGAGNMSDILSRASRYSKGPPQAATRTAKNPGGPTPCAQRPGAGEGRGPLGDACAAQAGGTTVDMG